MIPELPTNADAVAINVRPAAHDHLMAWDATQRLVAIHEAGHVCAAAAQGITAKSVDISLRHGGYTILTGPEADTSLPWETATRMLEQMAVLGAGSAAERLVLGDFTDGGASDLDAMVAAALRFIRAGFAPGYFVGDDGLPFGYLTDAIKTRTLEKIQEMVAEAQVRADALIAANEGALISVATAIYEKRRLSDDRLDEVLVAAGFILPRPTA